MTVMFYGWGPAFELPSPSPFVIKCETQLRMLGVELAYAMADLESVPKHKAPYVRDGEQLIQDSTFIRFHFEKKLGKDLDAGLTLEQRGVAWSVERLLEDRLTLIAAMERWLEADNFRRGPAQFFARVPEAARAKVCEQVQTDLRAMYVRHGIGRHTREERMQLAARDIEAVARVLGDKPYLFGSEPTAADASAFGVLVSCGTRFFSSELPDLIDAHPALRPYLARMESRYLTGARFG
jgi:glutathione S-transferase